MIITRDKCDPLEFQQQLNHEIKGVLPIKIWERNLHSSDQVDTVKNDHEQRSTQITEIITIELTNDVTLSP